MTCQARQRAHLQQKRAAGSHISLCDVPAILHAMPQIHPSIWKSCGHDPQLLSSSMDAVAGLSL